MQVLTWNSHSVDERISEAMSMVRELDELLKQIKGVEKRAHELAAEWSAHSLFERREGQVRHKGLREANENVSEAWCRLKGSA